MTYSNELAINKAIDRIERVQMDKTSASKLRKVIDAMLPKPKKEVE